MNGPYSIFIAESGERQIRGRHGKILFRYPAEQDALATEHCRRLQQGHGREIDKRAGKRALRHIEQAILALSDQPRVGSVASYLHSAFQELDGALNPKARDKGERS